MYLLVAVILVSYLYSAHRLSWGTYTQYGGLTGLGGLMVYFMQNRFGGGYVEDAMMLDEDAELRRQNRRSWQFSAIIVSIIFLLTGILYTIWS